jgi:DinB superfamily
MSLHANTEYWLRGPVAGIPAVLQPVAHALLQSRAEVNALMEGFPEEKLWERPAGVASPGFHLQHLAGVLDRLLTYARGEMLGPRQLEELGEEARVQGRTGGKGGAPSPEGRELSGLLERYNRQIDKALLQLEETPELSLTESRGVGRARIPSTVGGLLFHAAEHSMRHTGQLLVTIKILTTDISSGNR